MLRVASFRTEGNRRGGADESLHHRRQHLPQVRQAQASANPIRSPICGANHAAVKSRSFCAPTLRGAARDARQAVARR